MRKWQYVCLIVLFCSIAGYALENEGTLYERMPRALGIFRGDAGGTGLHYQTWVGKLGLSAAAGAFYDPAGNSGIQYLFNLQSFTLPEGTTFSTKYYSLIYNIGIEGQYKLYEEDFAGWLSGCLYLFLGLNHHGEQYYSKTYDPNGGSGVRKDHPLQFGWITAAGIGIEPVLFQHFSFPIEFGYALYSTGAIPFESVSLLNLTGQFGFRYRF